MNLRNSPASRLVSRPVILSGSLSSGVSSVLGALVLWFLLTPLSAFALVLGDEHVRSTLDQPFLLEIELLDWEEVDLERLQVSLASREDFQAFDLEYQSYMDELSFEVTTNSAGNAAAVMVRGSTPMQEPYLDMLISARWPGGAVLREYIVLLDLPGTPVAPSPLLAAAGSEVPASRTQAAPPAPAPATQAQTSAPNPETSGSRASYRVQPGDTLWSIASQVHPGEPGTNLYQTLVSLHELNPDAFVNTNITLLRNNHLMRIPGAADVRSVDAGLAREIYESRSNQGQARVDALRRGEPLPEFTDFAVLVADGAGPGAVATANEMPEEAPAPRVEEAAGRSDSSTLQLAYDETIADDSSLPDSEQAAQDDDLAENPFEREVALLESLLAERESEIQVLEQEVAQLTGQLAEAEASVARMTTSLQATIRQNQEGPLQQAPDNRSTLIFGGLSGLLALLLLLAGAAIFRLKLRLEEQKEELELLSEDGRGAAVLGFHPVLDDDEDDDEFDGEFDREFDEDSDDRDERRYEEEVEGEEMAAEPDVDERYAYYSIDIKNEEDEQPDDDEEEDDLDEAVYETDEEFLSAPSFFRAGDLNADDVSAEQDEDDPSPYGEEDIREHYYDERDRITDTVADEDDSDDDRSDSNAEAGSGETVDRGGDAGGDEDEVIEFRLSSETRQQAAQDATGETGFVERRRNDSDTEDDLSGINDPDALDDELREDMSDLDFSLDGLLVEVDDMDESEDEDSAQHPAADRDDIYSVDSEGNGADSAELDEPDHDRGNGDTRKNSF